MTAGVDTFDESGVVARSAWLLPATVGFYFSFRIFFVSLAGLLLGDPQGGVVINLGTNFLLLGIVAFCSWGPAPRTVGSVLRLPCMRWVLLFIGFSGFSLVWTAAASVPAAAAFWGAMAADTGIVVLLLRSGQIGEVASSLIRGYVWGACGVALIAWILPAQADLRLGAEGLLGANQIGYSCAIAVFFAQYLMLVEPGRWKVPTAFLAITVLRSLSKTTIVALVLGEIVVLLWDRSISRKAKTRVVLGAVLVLVLFSGLLIAYFDSYTNANDVESLTGRVGIWTTILDKALEQPWVGHGFHSVWKVIPPFGADQFEARHAHNEVLQQFYAYGVAGVGLLVGLYGSFFRMVRKMAASPLRTLLFGMLVFVLVRGLADTEPFDLSLPLWGICLWSAVVSETDSVLVPLA